MFNYEVHENSRFRSHFHRLVLSFLAGTINAGGYLAAGRFVSHVTGYATLAGVELAHHRFFDAIALLSIPGYFLLGVIAAAYWVEMDRNHKSRISPYVRIMALVFACLATVTLGGLTHRFGNFGVFGPIRQDYLLLSLLCGSSGLINSAISAASGSSVRVTHLTGLTTDLGIGLMRAYTCNNGEKRTQEIIANGLRLATISSFIAGSGVAAFLFLRFGYAAFALPTLLAGYSTFIAHQERLRLNLNYFTNS